MPAYNAGSVPCRPVKVLDRLLIKWRKSLTRSRIATMALGSFLHAANQPSDSVSHLRQPVNDTPPLWYLPIQVIPTLPITPARQNERRVCQKARSGETTAPGGRSHSCKGFQVDLLDRRRRCRLCKPCDKALSKPSIRRLCVPLVSLCG